MSPFTLTLLLMAAQAVALVVALRAGLWRAVPIWVFYVGVATIHIGIGLGAHAMGREYPISLLYFEPLFILTQIAFAFESGVRYLGFRLIGGPPERRLLLWLIPLVPAAIVMPLEIGFIQDALANWPNQMGDALHMVYTVRLYLSCTMFVVLAIIPVLARVGGRGTEPAAAIHHYVLAAYMACAAAGYYFKNKASDEGDYIQSLVFFLLGPTLCFLVWSWKMRAVKAAEFEPLDPLSTTQNLLRFERRAFRFENL